MTDWSHLSKDAFEEWYRTRYDDKEMDERQQRILREGLHCKVSLKLLHGSLWAIVIDPSAGFTHLMTEAGLQEMRKRRMSCTSAFASRVILRHLGNTACFMPWIQGTCFPKITCLKLSGLVVVQRLTYLQKTLCLKTSSVCTAAEASGIENFIYPWV